MTTLFHHYATAMGILGVAAVGVLAISLFSDSHRVLVVWALACITLSAIIFIIGCVRHSRGKIPL